MIDKHNRRILNDEANLNSLCVNLTDSQRRFLKRFAQNQFSGSEENQCTYKPIFVVQSQQKNYTGQVCENDENIAFFRNEYESEYDSPREVVEAYYEDADEECPIPIVDYDYISMTMNDINGNKVTIYDYDGYFKAYGISDVEVAGYYISWSSEAFFFIHEEAQRYCEYQAHNLSNPRVYTYSPGYSNCGEFEHFWNLLMDMGTELNRRDGIEHQINIIVRYDEKVKSYYYIIKEINEAYNYDSRDDKIYFDTAKQARRNGDIKRQEIHVEFLQNTKY